MKRIIRSKRMHTHMPVMSETGIAFNPCSLVCIELLADDDLKLLNANIDECEMRS